MRTTNLEIQLKGIINCESRENDSNTPDRILAEFMMSCLGAFEVASNKREVFFGVTLDILNNWEELIMTALGEASMCWSETPSGVFDSTKAAQIGKKLLADIKSGPSSATLNPSQEKHNEDTETASRRVSETDW